MEHLVARRGVSEWLAYRVLGQHRHIQHKKPTRPDDKAALTTDIKALAIQYGRYGQSLRERLLRELQLKAAG